MANGMPYTKTSEGTGIASRRTKGSWGTVPITSSMVIVIKPILKMIWKKSSYFNLSRDKGDRGVCIDLPIFSCCLTVYMMSPS